MEAEAKRRGQLPPTCERPSEVDQALLDKLTHDASVVLDKSAFNTVDFSRLFAQVAICNPSTSTHSLS